MKRKIDDDAIREAYDHLRVELGRAPSVAEMKHALGLTDWGHLRTRMDKLGLERHKMTLSERGKENARREKERRASGAAGFYDEVNEAEIFVKRRLREIREDGKEGEKKTAPMRAGEQYGVNDMLMISCAICKRRKMIKPRMHPYFVRRGDGEIVWLCGAECCGMMRWKDEGWGNG